MLVYANSFALNPVGGAKSVVELVAEWVGKPRKTFVDPMRLASGIRELKLPDGATLSSRVTRENADLPIFPYHFCASLVHGQIGVPGRRWTTEIGLRQVSENSALDCSVLLKTDEISARVTSPIQATRPRIVQILIENCNPVLETPGLSIKRVTEINARAFDYEIEHESRRYPIVLVSCDHRGIYPVTPERMRSVLMGLAQVIDIPSEADTYEIQRIIGRRYSAYGGAINIIFPVRKTEEGRFCKTVLLRADQLVEIEETGATIESEVLATITHQTNLPHSWRHISSEIVGQAILRERLKIAVAGARDSDELQAYEALLQEAADQLEVKDGEINDLRIDLEDSQASLDQSRADNEGLKHALSGSQSRSSVEVEGITNALSPLREAMRSVVNDKASLEQVLRLISGLYSDRIFVLDTAFESAKESDGGGFRFGRKAFDLLIKLAEDYWTALAEGRGDQQARSTFGQNGFAAKESDTLSNDGKRRRTFNYHGRDILMEKHLKHGVKDSLAETLRIHFEWLSDDQKIVIGHCGKHLNF